MFRMSKYEENTFLEDLMFFEYRADNFSLKIRTDRNGLNIQEFCDYFLHSYHRLKPHRNAQKYFLDTVLSQFYLEIFEQGLPEYEPEKPDDSAHLNMNVILYGSEKAKKMKPYRPPRAKKSKKEKEAFSNEVTAKRFSYLIERLLESAHLPATYKGYLEHITGNPEKETYQLTLKNFL